MPMKKIYGNGIYDNENAELATADFVKFAIVQIDSSIKWLSNTNEIAQDVLADIDLLLAITKQNPTCTNLLLEKQKILAWEAIFNEWFRRVYNKIPYQYRDNIETDGKNLFKELKKYCNDLQF